jgi:ribonuclease R
MAAERETIDRLIAHSWRTGSGPIRRADLRRDRAGLFVKLAETGADGFVPASTIGADYYRYEEAKHALVGDRTGETYRLGDRVTVQLVEAAPVAGALRFEILSEGRRDGAAARGRGPGHKRGAPNPWDRKARGKGFSRAPDRSAGKGAPVKAAPAKPAPARAAAPAAAEDAPAGRTARVRIKNRSDEDRA